MSGNEKCDDDTNGDAAIANDNAYGHDPYVSAMLCRQHNNVALEHPYQVVKLCSKFGLILPSGLGGNSVMDGQTDGWMKEFTMSPSLKSRDKKKKKKKKKIKLGKN